MSGQSTRIVLTGQPAGATGAKARLYSARFDAAQYIFKGQGRVAERLLATPPKQVGISAIVLHELQTGIAKSTQPEKRRNQLESLVKAAVLLPFGQPEAGASALIRADLERAAGHLDCRHGAHQPGDPGYA
jgi:predicted nucleic acid-binding protein